jgi:hypothetical protein
LKAARTLPPQEQRRLRELLAEEAPKSIGQIAAEQGIEPINFEELGKLGEFWPEDESIDDFIAAVREWRRDDPDRSID